MPSLTPMVLNRRPIRPAACTPSLTCAASLSRCMLQVLPSHHMLQIPTCGFCRSAGVRPVPYSIACDAPWLRGWVMRELYLFAATCHLLPAAGSERTRPTLPPGPKGPGLHYPLPTTHCRLPTDLHRHRRRDVD